jgi:adenosine/AMP kinase
MQLHAIRIDIPSGTNVILAQSHFIKTVEDVYEALACASPRAAFGIAFNEASGERRVRVEGNDPELSSVAAANAERVGAGHLLVILLREVFPINVLPALRQVPEICRIFCATANPLEVIVAETAQGRAVLGVVDGECPLGIEDEAGRRWRHDFLRQIGYKK